MTRAPANAATLTDLLHARLRETPDAELGQFVDAAGTIVTVSVRQMMARAMAFAARFGRADKNRHIIAICLYHGLDLHAAFWGALWAGHIPTMFAPPSPRMELAKYLLSFRHMMDVVRPDTIVLDEKVHTAFRALGDAPASEDIVDPSDVAMHGDVEPVAQQPDDIALLQHSSGTTGLQKGVALSHRAILSHQAAYAARLGVTPQDRIASWLPLYHDMGLIACFLLPTLARVPFVEISPFDWAARPASLLEQIARTRATFVWLPNFAYSYLADSVRESQLPANLDLACVRAFINCSEPVHATSHDRFLARYQSAGVSRAQLTASYAMAENVFGVTQSETGDYKTLAVDRRAFGEHRVEPATDSSLRLVSNGRPLPTTQVEVCSEHGESLGEDRVGELRIRGAHLFAGYFRRDDLTAAAMHDGWYYSGDLGFIHDGEIYVTGRKKDLVIIQGRNFYPTDIEAVAACVTHVVEGRVVAFSLADEKTGTERLVVLAEIDPAARQNEKQIALQIRQTIAQTLDCTPADVRIVDGRWIVKSSSGKLARNDNRDKYLRELTGTPHV